MIRRYQTNHKKLGDQGLMGYRKKKMCGDHDVIGRGIQDFVLVNGGQKGYPLGVNHHKQEAWR